MYRRENLQIQDLRRELWSLNLELARQETLVEAIAALIREKQSLLNELEKDSSIASTTTSTSARDY